MAVLVVLVRRNCCAVGAGVRRAVANEVSGAAEKETGPAAVRRVPPGLLGALPVHALGVLDIIVVVRDVGPRQFVCDYVADAAHLVFSVGCSIYRAGQLQLRRTLTPPFSPPGT